MLLQDIVGNIQSFLEKLSGGEEVEIRFSKKEMMIQGYYKDGKAYMNIQQWKPILKGYFWKCEGKDLKECNEKFFKAKLFDGKTFWDAEQEIEWIDT